MWPNSQVSMSKSTGRASFMLKTVVAPVGDDQGRIADRAVGGCAQRDDHEVEVAPGPADPVFHRVAGFEELVKP